VKSIFKDERWGILQQEKENGEAITYVFEKNGVKIIYPFIKRKAGLIDQVEYFDLVTPRGKCGPWIEGQKALCNAEIIDAFNTEFDQYCKDANIIAEYIRFCPFDNQSNCFTSIYNTNYYGQVFCNDLTIDFFNLEYSSEARRCVRVAERNGVEIVFDTTPNSIDDFLHLYAFTESKHNVSDYYHIERNFVERYFKIMPENVLFANAVYKDEVIISSLNLMGEDIVHGQFVGINPKYLFLNAYSLLVYKLALYGARMGKKLLDVAGAKEGSSLERSKGKYVKGGKVFPYDFGTKIRNKDIYDMLVIQAGGPREGYFPAYRR
jgi:serine/alanine adding enzyme